MKLCISTFMSVLVKCKAHSTTQVELGRTMLNLLHPNIEGDYSDSSISDIVNGKKNVSDCDIDDAKKCDAKQLATAFKDNVISRLDSNKMEAAVLALQNIIMKDTDIKGETVLDLCENLTKDAVISRDTFVLHSLITGLFLYTVLYTKNRNTNSFAKEITDDYIAGFSDSEKKITFIEAYSKTSSIITKDIADDAHAVALLAEAEGRCLHCGRPIATSDGVKAVSRAKSVTLPSGDEVIVCADCSCKIPSMTAEELTAISEKAKNLHNLNNVRDDLSFDRLDGDIESVLMAINDLDTSDIATLRLDPITVERKITDKRLHDRVKNDVITLFDGVHGILGRLSGENLIDSNKLARQIRRMYEDAESRGLSQSDIYAEISDTLFRRSGMKYREASEVIVSYFVQRCEVFNEITE